jgi:hypothetical protein
MATVGFQKSNSTIQNGRILSSSIDMDGGVISNHALPVAGTDVANKNYVDASSGSGVPSINISLSGVAWTEILLDQEGDISISVKNSITNGPSARFILSKNEPGREASISRLNSCAGTTSEERLEIRWSINDSIELRKNGTNYDGTYVIKYILND